MMNDLFSAKTRKSFQLREDWMRKLFANPNIEPIHKLVMVAFTFWYYPEQEKTGKGILVDYAALAALIGMPEDETEQALLDMVKAGVFSLHDAHGHELDMVNHYTCRDCGHEWTEEQAAHEHAQT